MKGFGGRLNFTRFVSMRVYLLCCPCRVIDQCSWSAVTWCAVERPQELAPLGGPRPRAIKWRGQPRYFSELRIRRKVWKYVTTLWVLIVSHQISSFYLYYVVKNKQKFHSKSSLSVQYVRISQITWHATISELVFFSLFLLISWLFLTKSITLPRSTVQEYQNQLVK